MTESRDDSSSSSSDCTDIQTLCRKIQALEQRAAQAELENRAFRELAEHIREVFWMTTPLGDQLIYISPAYEAIWGQTCDSLYEEPGRRLAWVHAADRERVLTAFKRDARAGRYDETYRIDRPDGEVRWIRDRAWRVLDDDGDLYRLAGFALDVTDRVAKDDHLNRLGDALATRERLEVLAALGAGIAHDMAQPLTAARMHLARVRTEASDTDETARTICREADDEIRRASDIVHHLRDYAQKGQPSLGWLKLQDLLSDLHELVDTALRGARIDYTLTVDAATADREIAIDRIFVQQILRNLVQNAIDALADHDPVLCPQRRIEVAVHIVGDHEIEFCVGDNGPGVIDRETLFRAFDTGKTEGLGLGLYVSRSLAHTHGGVLTLREDDPDWPTVFVLRLPINGDIEPGRPPDIDVSAVDA